MEDDNHSGTETEFLEELVKEVNFFIEKIRDDDSQEMRRAFCRSLFQFVDGVSSDMKSLVASYESPKTIGEDFYLSLFDKVKINKNGKEKVFIRRPGFAKNIDFAFDASGSVAGKKFDIKDNKAEWNRFKECIAIRNRVVHPKSKSDLDITISDIKKMLIMYSWLIKKLEEINNLVAESFLQQSEAMVKTSRLTKQINMDR